MGIFAIASDGQQIGKQGWDQQFGIESSIIHLCTMSEEKERVSDQLRRILQMPARGRGAVSIKNGNNPCMYAGISV